jgi:ABC-2 type transport system permease protein
MIISSSGGQSANDLSQLLNVPNGGLIMNLILAGILLMSIAMNSVSYTAFSREGRTYWMSLTIPVKRTEQINAKLMNCVAIETVFATLITVALSLLFRRSLSDILTVIALLVPAMISPICVNMALDALMPKLDWVTPQQLFKRGIFTILFFLLSLVPVGIMGATAVFLLNKQVSANLIYVSIICLSVVIAAVTYELLLMASKNFYKLPQ